MANERRLLHLDALRGLAALVVVVGHIRGFVLVDFAESGSRSLFNMAVYFATGLGHAAVLAFFALSGFLVGGSALRSMSDDTWSGTRYMVARLTRLWTVAIPALALTWGIDLLAMQIAGTAGYDGQYWSLLSSGLKPDDPPALGIDTLVGNLLFLQTIAVPVFGSNGPLWSLANEFWYYVVYPLAAWAAIGYGPRWLRCAGFVVALTLTLVLPPMMMFLGVIWVAGALAHVVLNFEGVRRVAAHSAYLAATLLLVIGSLVLGALRVWSLGVDLLQGFAWALVLPALALLGPPGGSIGGWYRSLAIMLSEMSYTLYAIHFPILAAIYFVTIAPTQWAPGPTALGIGAGLLLVTLAGAGAVWWLFERNTLTIRRIALHFLGLDHMKAEHRGAV